MTINLEGKKAVVTGGAGGLGLVMAEKLARCGAELAIMDLSQEALDRCVPKLREKCSQVRAYRLDISKSEEVEAAFEQIDGEMGFAEILVSCAGVANSKLLMEMEDSQWESVMRINVTGTYYVCRAAARRMIANRRGRMVNISSLASKRISVLASGAYTASKYAVNGLTRHLAYELAPYGITVNAVCPGETLTEMTKVNLGEEMYRNRVGMNPSGRLCLPEDHANLVAFLASDEASMINGQLIDVDGGSQLSWMRTADYFAAKGKNI